MMTMNQDALVVLQVIHIMVVNQVINIVMHMIPLYTRGPGAISTGAGGDDDNDDIADEGEPNTHPQMDHLRYMPDKEALDGKDGDTDMIGGAEEPGKIGTSTGDTSNLLANLDTSNAFVSIPELQATVWTQTELLFHFLQVCNPVDRKDWQEIGNMLRFSDLYSARNSLLKAVEQWMISIAGQAPNLPNREDLKDVMNHLNVQWKSLKLKVIAVKHIRIPNHIVNSADENDEKSSSIWLWLGGGGSNSGNKSNDKIASPLEATGALFKELEQCLVNHY